MSAMNRRRVVWTMAAALLAVGPIVSAQESLRITPFVRDNQVLVSFELADAYSEAVHDAIASGLRTTFSYELELRTVVPGLGRSDDRTDRRSDLPNDMLESDAAPFADSQR